MSGTIEKAAFLRNKFIPLLRTIDPEQKPLWGKMNVHQMIEHMSYSMRQANGKDKYTLLTSQELLPRMESFLMSEKPFRENTPNKLLPDDPEAPIQPTIEAAIEELQEEIEDFFDVYNSEPSLIITNPFFGHLNYERQVQLLYKHALHHLKQFGVSQE
ncbi:MAG: hypothetical protein H6551_00735 [Chitinophagales bacterium]|nr:hypothetical protein [Chitinophagaceae bacterium]MCB9063648.1 hypothetical protein [Chitinophagales bacterium]